MINIIIIITPCSAEGAVLISTSQSQFRLLAYTVPLDLRFCQVYSFGPYLLLFSVRNTDTHTLLSFTQYRKKPQDQDPTVAVNHLRGRGRATRTQVAMKVCRFNKLLKCSNDFPLPVALPLRPLHIRLPCDDVEISRDVSRIFKEAVICNKAALA